MLEFVNCNYCGQDDTELILELSPFQIVRCKVCGLIYGNPRLSWADSKRIYTDQYYISNDPVAGGYEDYIRDESVLVKTFKRRLADIERYVKGGRLLDLGCALGFFMKVAHMSGWDVTGLDICPYACSYVKERFGFYVICSELKDDSFSEGIFDIVTMWDYIEHVPDPLNELKIAYKILRPNGLLAVTTPNVKSWIAKITGKRWLGFKCPKEHIFYFSPKSITMMLEKAGFTVLCVKSVGKYFRLDVAKTRIKDYSKLIGKFFEFSINTLSVLDRSIYVNEGGTMAVFAKKVNTPEFYH